MSLKIKALNEDEESFDDDTDVTGRPSKEAQEELSILKYNQALQTLREGKTKEAVLLLEEIVYEDDLKQLSAPQQKLQLGCLKVLGDLYRDGECKNLERCKVMYERAIYFDQAENNINFWYRLGKVCYEMGDLYSAHMAFGHALSIRPGHWNCLEYMITTSYAIQDYTGCLGYCASGLALDEGFLKGKVFRELVLSLFPELGNPEVLNKVQNGQPQVFPNESETKALTKKFMDELKCVQVRCGERNTKIQRQASIPMPQLHLNLRSFSIVEVVHTVLYAYENTFRLAVPEFHKPLEITWAINEDMEIEEVGKSGTADESQTEEESQSGIRRSRSSSDDKENTALSNVDSASQQEADGGDKPQGENGSEAAPMDGQPPVGDMEAGGKKKNRRDVKWWQIEGKRRSQRVRGHLMPTSPDKAKKESSFADQLKNLIPAPLLGDDGSTCEREVAKTTEKCGRQKKVLASYFGTKDEESHVKQLLIEMNGCNLTGIIRKLVQFLTLKVKYPWPSQLRELFLILYRFFRSSVPYPSSSNSDAAQVITDSFACICFIEVILEKYKVELTTGEKDFSKLVDQELFVLDECLLLSEPLPKDLILREKWATVRRLLQVSVASNDSEVHGLVCQFLSEMEKDLRKEPMTVWTVNETSNLICLESVAEKAVGIAKTQNSQVVTDLFQSQQYESLVDILRSCIKFSEIEKRDLLDIYYYTIALFRTNNCDCIHHCLNLMNQAIRFQDNNSLAEALVLLEQIWEKMSSQFTLQNKRSSVGTLIKILVTCERKAPSQESILTVPWCLLHSILFSLEQNEPAFYLEEETVPNSVLLLQMAHECMSRSEKCCVDGGKLMLYTMKQIVKVKKHDEYMAYEETKHCMEQAIFCMYSHPGKKTKVKYLKDHNSNGTMLTWEMCPTLYRYYYPDEVPEFDSIGSIGSEVEGLFLRILEIMPAELSPVNRQKQLKTAISMAHDLVEMPPDQSFPKEIQDIYYLIADNSFKSKEWQKAVSYYTWDLAVNQERFDSWAAIALCVAEKINTNLNTADDIVFKDLLAEAKRAVFCFRNALKVEPGNIKLRIEFGSFVYAMHGYCSRLMKQQQATDIDMDRFHMIEMAKDEFLKSSCKCFELIAKNSNEANDSTTGQTGETVEDELWIHHYMLGKINEKMKEDPEEFLKQYELAGQLLHSQGAPYPSKMNYYSPPELAIEALEIYYRIHASILNMVETMEYSLVNEKLCLQYIRRQEESPFIKNKQSKESGESKKGRKATEDAVSKKDMTEISSLLSELIDKAEKIAESEPAESAVTSSAVSTTTTTDDETSTDSQSAKSDHASKPTVSCFSLAEFRKRLQEKEQRQEQLASEAVAKKVEEPSSVPEPPTEPENIYEGLDLDSNPFHADFKDVKYGAVISFCLKAMEECISRYSSHHKSYYRLAHSYTVFIGDCKRAREYLMGSPSLNQRKIAGLFGERKPTNFFNGIWRNPIDDIDRPGSFSYHMNKAMQLLLDVLSKLNDHALLADIGIHLTKVPENDKKYLINPDREMFCQQAWNMSVAAAKKKVAEVTSNFNELGIEIFETYTKFQKHNPKGHPLTNCLHDVYKMMLTSQGHTDENVQPEDALRYFSYQYSMMRQATNRNNRATGQSNGDLLKAGGDGPVPRKRGRRGRQASQEAQLAATAASNLGSQHFDMTKQSYGMMDNIHTIPMLSLISGGMTTPYPTMNINPAQLLLSHAALPSPFDVSKLPKANPPTTLSKQPQGKVAQLDASGSDLERSRSNVLDQAQHKASKPRRGGPSKEAKKDPGNKYPPPPQPNTLRINTSPYKTQSTIVEQPPEFSYNRKSTDGASSNDRKNPPAAHSQTTPKRTTPPSEQTNEEENVEVIDLTVKTPEKDKAKNTVPPKKQAVVRNPVFLSQQAQRAPNNQIVDLRALAENPVPIIPSPRSNVHNPRPVVSNPRHSVPNLRPISNPTPSVQSAHSNVTTPVPSLSSPRNAALNVRPRANVPTPAGVIVSGSRQSIPSPRSTVSNIMTTIPSTSPNIKPMSNPKTSKPVAKTGDVNIRLNVPIMKLSSSSESSTSEAKPGPNTSNLRANPTMNPRSNIKASSSNPRPSAPVSAPTRPAPPIQSYPLPPKKKHHQLMLASQSLPATQLSNCDDDIEKSKDRSPITETNLRLM